MIRSAGLRLKELKTGAEKKLYLGLFKMKILSQKILFLQQVYLMLLLDSQKNKTGFLMVVPRQKTLIAPILDCSMKSRPQRRDIAKRDLSQETPSLS